MKKLALFIFLIIGTSTFAQAKTQMSKSPSELVPAGYVITETVEGDLNKDNQKDYVLIIKATDKTKFVKDPYNDGQLDRNRRGIIIAFKNKDKYELALINVDCFSSENEDGGVYFPPELYANIKKGNLYLHYAHGRYGYWAYNFRYQNSDFELIGYESSYNFGPIVRQTLSINLLSNKMRIRKNVNIDIDPENEKFEESWTSFKVPKTIKLRSIDDFDGLQLESYLTKDAR